MSCTIPDFSALVFFFFHTHTTHHECKIATLGHGIPQPEFVKRTQQDVSPDGVFFPLVFKKVALVGLFESGCCCFLQRRVGTKYDARGRGQSRANKGWRPDEPADAPPRGSKRF